MNQKPADAVTPDEIVSFLKKQNVSEEAATGIRLLRRAAETIAWLTHQANTIPETTYLNGEKPNENPDLFKESQVQQILGSLDLMQGYAFFNPEQLTEQAIEKIGKLNSNSEALDQVSLALGLEDDSLDGVLDKIETLINERDNHISAIQQRDQVIQQAEDQLEHFNKLQPHLTLTPDQQAFQEALKFGYALVGYSYESGLPQWIVNGAKGIIEYSQQE